MPESWLNDAVKGFFSATGRRIYTPRTEYLLAMKCLAMRMGQEFQDVEDIRFLLRELRIRNLAEAEQILAEYYAPERYPARCRYVLEELIAKRAAETAL
jgi:hypothetical protein